MRFLALIILVASAARGATYYVDGAASGANNGTNWANAWSTIAAISGLAAGDTVYISGGAAGGTQTYSMAAYWNPTSGTAGNRITYQIGQDSAHNGTAIFNYTGGSPASNPWLSGPRNIVVSGNAGDGQRHFRLTNYTLGISNVGSAKFEYLESLTGLTEVADFRASGSQTTGIELGHSYFYLTDLTGNRAIYGDFSGTTWDENLIHDTTLYVPSTVNGAVNGSGGNGYDALQLNGNGYTVRNTVIVYYQASFTGGQHGDGWQGTGGSQYVKFNSNLIIDCPNYALFGEAYAGDWIDIIVTNNVAALSNSTMANAAGPGGIIFGVNNGSRAFTRVIIANNILVAYRSNIPIALNNVTGTPATFTSCLIQNNALIDSGTISITGNATSTVDHNVPVAASAGPTTFVAYTQYGGAANDYHLLPAATALIGQGTNLYSTFAADKDGFPLPNAGAWNAGAYTGPTRINSAARRALAAGL